MKRILLILPLLAVSFNSCLRGDHFYFKVPSNYSLQFDARKSLTKSVSINTNMTDWDFKLFYDNSWDGETGETDWCEVEKTSSTALTVTCTLNENEMTGREAYIEFYIDGEVYGTIQISQTPFQWTLPELQLKDAQSIISGRNDMSLDIDLASLHGETNLPKYKGVFHYTAGGRNLDIPVIATVLKSTSFDHVGISTDPDAGSEMSVSGTIYTGYENGYSVDHYRGDFEIRIYGYFNGTYYTTTITD